MDCRLAFWFEDRRVDWESALDRSLDQIETEFIEANGLRFEVLTCGSGEALVLCLHGFPEVALSWREQMLMLARMGYRVWAPNQRGYGRSSRPGRMEDYAIERLMEDVAGLIDAAKARRVVLLGHDWGALVAWTFAARRVRPIDRLVIINVPHPACFARELRTPGQLLRSWYVGFFQLPRVPELVLGRRRAALVGRMMLRTSTDRERFPRDLVEAVRDNASQPGALTAMLNWYRAFVRGGGLARQMRLGWPVIEVPTLMVWGDRDVALSLRTTVGTDRHVRDLRFVRLQGVSHWVQQDATERCHAELRAFLEVVGEG